MVNGVTVTPTTTTTTKPKNKMNTEKAITPDKQLVAQSLRALWARVGVSPHQGDDADDDNDEDEGYAVRLQVLGADWRLWVGDSSYDTDHRGHWGAIELPLREEPDFDDLAEDLLDQVEDSIAMQD